MIPFIFIDFNLDRSQVSVLAFVILCWTCEFTEDT